MRNRIRNTVAVLVGAAACAALLARRRSRRRDETSKKPAESLLLNVGVSSEEQTALEPVLGRLPTPKTEDAVRYWIARIIFRTLGDEPPAEIPELVWHFLDEVAGDRKALSVAAQALKLGMASLIGEEGLRNAKAAQQLRRVVSSIKTIQEEAVDPKWLSDRHKLVDRLCQLCCTFPNREVEGIGDRGATRLAETMRLQAELVLAETWEDDPSKDGLRGAMWKRNMNRTRP